MKKLFLILFLLLNVYQGHTQRLSQRKPNIIIIYLDDLGYGDVGCYGAKGVKTPNVDRLAKHGIKFTDAHSSAATCTPSRFSLLKHYYNRKIAEGKNKMSVVNAVRNKLVQRIFAVVRDGRNYVENYQYQRA